MRWPKARPSLRRAPCAVAAPLLRLSDAVERIPDAPGRHSLVPCGSSGEGMAAGGGKKGAMPPYWELFHIFLRLLLTRYFVKSMFIKKEQSCLK